MQVTWSWPVFLDALLILAMLVIPMGAKDWQDALKASVGLAFAAGGAGILFSGADGEILVTALFLLSAAVLLEVQDTVNPQYRSRPYLVWASAAVVVAASPWDGLIGWVNDTRRWLAIIVLLVVGHLAVVASRKRLKGTTTRSGPPDEQREPEHSLQVALSAAVEARGFLARGRVHRAASEYHRSLAFHIVHASLLRHGAANSRASDSTAACFALGALGEEGISTISRSLSPRFAVRYARKALTGAHLADPTEGDAARVAQVKELPPVDRLDPHCESPLASFERSGDDALDAAHAGPVTALERVALAGVLRMRLAEMIAEHPRAARNRLPWRETPEHEFFCSFVIPGCEGLPPAAEAAELARQAVRIWTELAVLEPSLTKRRDRAQEQAAQIARATAPRSARD
ncbi:MULTISPECIES: hypothetical protein [Actinomadura]|uniref:Uncharacterized protein n=1 Tax=Actinomadura yumaensis TaxID=111807 RepID=A0ABW2CRT7_9ACTN|nr:hypothetical protein [Actinomadura sp. J1-007]MWK34099.1 hypothetical protein [Actinomadura sp. J1-007]